jgi:hypothetical protein
VNFSDFVGGSVEGTLGVFGVVILVIMFFALVLKVIEAISNGATRLSGQDPKSREGESRSTRIGFTLFGVFILFALFIAPLISKR